MSEHRAGRRGRAAPNHVPVGAADVCGYHLENDAVIDRFSGGIAEGWKVDLLNFDVAGFEVNHAAVGMEAFAISSRVFTSTVGPAPNAADCQALQADPRITLQKLPRLKEGSLSASTSALTLPNVVSGLCLIPS